MILKPVAEGGKRGISVCNSLEDASTAIEYAASESKRGYDIIAEEFIQGGIECSVETLSCQGKHYVIQVTEKLSSGPPHCVELGHIQPARISVETRRKINVVIPAMLDALKYDSGPSHTEIKILDGKIYLIECNTRPGGDFISYPLVDLSTGYHFLRGAIQIALGEFIPPNYEVFLHDHAGVVFITEQTKGLKPVFDSCQNMPWCFRKHDTGQIDELQHNSCEEISYFIWHSKDGMPFDA